MIASLHARDKNEQGFTLIELLVVILIIGILAAIAIPMFLNQRKEAVAATMVSDIKNAATAMEQESVRNQGKYPSAVPVYDKQSKDNMVYLDATRSSIDSFCLIAKNLNHEDLTYSYSSSDGGMLPKGKTCATATLMGDSINSALASKKVLIVNSGRGATSWDSNAANAVAGAGVTAVDTIANGTLTAAKAKNYDLVVLVGGAWSVNYIDRSAATDAYNNYGTKVLTDGNDSNGGHIPFINTAVSRQSTGPGIDIGVNPTYADGLTPSFPYTFKASGFPSSDTWSCTKTVNAGVVVMGDSPDPQASGEKCLTMIGATSSAGGRWVHFTVFSTTISDPGTDPTVAAVKWLLQ